MKKIKILQFPIANSQGGITHYILENWRWIDKKKFHFDFATMSKQLDYAEEILVSGSKIFYISCYAEENRDQFEKEFDEILKEGYDVVHLHTKQWKSFLVEELCRKHGVSKVIVHAHSSGIDTADVTRRSKEEKLHCQVKMSFDEGMATDFWACSRKAADFLFGEQIPENKIKIVPNAIKLNEFMYKKDIRNRYRKKYGLENFIVIGHVGRFAYQKNHKFLIDVFKEVLKEGLNAKLVLIGEGELFLEMKRYAQSLSVEDNILFLGKRNDIHNWYQAMDVFCLPSRFEGFPIALVEAQAAGLPCIGSTMITEEIEICQDTVRKPLREKDWLQQILSFAKKKRGDNNIMLLRQAGYDIQNQINAIENLYSESGNNLLKV